MTIPKELFLRPTDNLIHASKTCFYPVSIPVPHPQLRSFISAVTHTRIYYADKYDIYSLSLCTKERSLIATLPFEARCLAAKYGWICVGGEFSGVCAFIRLEDECDLDDFSSGSQESLHQSRHPRCFGHELHVKELGGDIVNSMNIHKLRPLSSPEEEELVVLISNNDQTVKIYSLADQKVLTTLRHPMQMNFAALSPDSQILVTVGDSNRAFFHQQIEPKKKGENPWNRKVPNWRGFGAPRMPTGDRSHDDHSFSIAFSETGRLCAVSSQGGMITVFNLEPFLDSDSDLELSAADILCTFKSSREPLWGCVRSMAFAPEPWDMLAWAEDHGRAGIADVRQDFVRRQTIKLDTEAANVNRVEIEDATPTEYKVLDVKAKLKRQYIQRLVLEETPDAGGLRTDQLLSDARADRRLEASRRRQARRDMLPHHHGLDLDTRERSITDTLETTMDELSEDPAPSTEPTSVSYSVPLVRMSSQAPARGRFAEGGSLSNAPLDDLIQQQILEAQHRRSQTGQRYRERVERVANAERNGERSYLPRRQSSVILSRSNTAGQQTSMLAPVEISRDRLSASPARIPRSDSHSPSADELPPLLSTNDLTPTTRASSSQQLPYSIPTSDPWHVIESALVAARRADLAATVAGEDQEDSSTMTPSTISIDPDRYTRILQARALQRASMAAYAESAPTSINVVPAVANTTTPPDSRPISQASARPATSASRPARVIRAVTSELPSQLSETDVRLARLMMTVTNSRSILDQNGNWIAGDTLQRMMIDRARESEFGTQSISANDARAAAAGADADGMGGGARVTFDDLVREMGVGTAGIGWSPNGRCLFVGTEKGIFEYPVNFQDRMQFPACEFR